MYRAGDMPRIAADGGKRTSRPGPVGDRPFRHTVVVHGTECGARANAMEDLGRGLGHSGYLGLGRGRFPGGRQATGDGGFSGGRARGGKPSGFFLRGWENGVWHFGRSGKVSELRGQGQRFHLRLQRFADFGFHLGVVSRDVPLGFAATGGRGHRGGDSEANGSFIIASL